MVTFRQISGFQAANIHGVPISISTAFWDAGTIAPPGGYNFFVVWTDLSGDTGCNTASDAPTNNPSSSCQTRIWLARCTVGLSIGQWVISRITPAQTLYTADEFHPRLIQLPIDTGIPPVLIVVYYRSGTATTGNTTPRLSSDVFMRISEDVGESWTLTSKLTTAVTNEAASGVNPYQYGDYLGLTGQHGFYFAAWTDRRGGNREQIWARPFAFPPPPEPCSDPLLTDVQISFFTKDDDKNDDTDLSIQLYDRYNIITSYDVPNGTHFDNGQTNGPYELPIGFARSSKTNLLTGKVHLKISVRDTSGNDTWRFKFGLDFTFTDGTHTYVETPGVINMSSDDVEHTTQISSMA